MRTFWIYENWVAESKAVIHRGDCSFCRKGEGIHPSRVEGRNGRWHGPFASYEEALSHANALRRRMVRNYSFCNPAP